MTARPRTAPAGRPARHRRELELLVRGEHGSPHSILGPHPHDGGVTVRAFKPLAKRVAVRHGDGTSHELAPRARGRLGRRAAGRGRARLPPRGDLRRRSPPRGRRPVPVPADARRDGPAPGQRGPARLLWTVLGARSTTTTRPSATRSPVRRSRCGPRPRGRPAQGGLQQLGRPRAPDARARASGVWELFVPGVGSGNAYKYVVLGADGAVA